MQHLWYHILRTSHSAIHFITYFLGQSAGAVQVHLLAVPDTNSHVLTDRWEARKATFLQALYQMLPHRPVIVLDLAWIITTANVVCKC